MQRAPAPSQPVCCGTDLAVNYEIDVFLFKDGLVGGGCHYYTHTQAKYMNQ